MWAGTRVEHQPGIKASTPPPPFRIFQTHVGAAAAEREVQGPKNLAVPTSRILVFGGYLGASPVLGNPNRTSQSYSDPGSSAEPSSRAPEPSSLNMFP